MRRFKAEDNPKSLTIVGLKSRARRRTSSTNRSNWLHQFPAVSLDVDLFLFQALFDVPGLEFQDQQRLSQFIVQFPGDPLPLALLGG